MGFAQVLSLIENVSGEADDRSARWKKCLQANAKAAFEPAAAKADPAAGWNEDRVRQAMNAYTCLQSMGRGKGYIFRKP